MTRENCENSSYLLLTIDFTEGATILDSLFDIFSGNHRSLRSIVENKVVNIRLLGFLDLSP